MDNKIFGGEFRKKNHNSQFREQVIREINTLSLEDENEEMMDDDRNFEKSYQNIENQLSE